MFNDWKRVKTVKIEHFKSFPRVTGTPHSPYMSDNGEFTASKCFLEEIQKRFIKCDLMILNFK
jgi:hypothetical protein